MYNVEGLLLPEKPPYIFTHNAIKTFRKQKVSVENITSKRHTFVVKANENNKEWKKI